MLFSNNFRSLFFSSWYLFDCSKNGIVCDVLVYAWMVEQR